MSHPSSQAITQLLLAWGKGDQNALEKLRRIALDEAPEVAAERDADLIALDDALKSLAEMSPRQSQIVELRYFGGLSEEEVAEVLKISTRTVRRDWSLARAWFYRELSRGGNDEA